MRFGSDKDMKRAIKCLRRQGVDDWRIEHIIQTKIDKREETLMRELAEMSPKSFWDIHKLVDDLKHLLFAATSRGNIPLATHIIKETTELYDPNPQRDVFVLVEHVDHFMYLMKVSDNFTLLDTDLVHAIGLVRKHIAEEIILSEQETILSDLDEYVRLGKKIDWPSKLMKFTDAEILKRLIIVGANIEKVMLRVMEDPFVIGEIINKETIVKIGNDWDRLHIIFDSFTPRGLSSIAKMLDIDLEGFETASDLICILQYGDIDI